MNSGNPTIPYHPAFWLAALGAGGLSISFFMYLMWMLPHPDTAMPTWTHVQAMLSGQMALAPGVRVVASAALVAMLLLAALHFVLLGWNVRRYFSPQGKSVLGALRGTPAQVQLLSIPLTMTMTVNVVFASGALFVPGLWSVVEYLFPFAIVALAIIGSFALRMYGSYLSRMLVEGGYRAQEHNHLSPLMAAFAFAMLSVSFAAPAAMSHNGVVAALAATLSIFFLMLAAMAALIGLGGGVVAMLTHGLQLRAAPSLWMLVPILTLLAIEWVRMQHGLTHHFATPLDAGNVFYTLTAMFMMEIVVLIFGTQVMRRNGYFRQYLLGAERDPVSFGLICPGVALVVMGMFWWHMGWVQTGLTEKFSVAYWLGVATLAVVQLLTALALLRLVWKMFPCCERTETAH